MKWFYLPVALTVVSGCATAPAPVAVRPAAPAAAPAEFDYSSIPVSDEFKPVAVAPAKAAAAIYAPGSVEPGFSDDTAQPVPVAAPAARKAPAAPSRHSDAEGSLVARSR